MEILDMPVFNLLKNLIAHVMALPRHRTSSTFRQGPIIQANGGEMGLPLNYPNLPFLHSSPGFCGSVEILAEAIYRLMKAPKLEKKALKSKQKAHGRASY